MATLMVGAGRHPRYLGRTMVFAFEGDMTEEHNAIRRLSVNGFEMPYVEQGEGEPVLFVHGSLQDHRAWDEHLPIVAQRRRAIAVDQRYFGADNWLDEGEHFSMQTHIDDLIGFVRALDAGPVTVVGWSLGGAVSLAAAVRDPTSFRRLFLYEASLATFVTDPAEARAAAESRAAAFGEGFALVQTGDLTGAARLMIDGVNRAGFYDRLPPSTSNVYVDNARTLPLALAAPPPPEVTPDDLRALAIPVALVHGSATLPFFKIIARTAASLLPAATLNVVDKAVHLWPGLEPAAFCRLLIEFLDRDR